MWKNSQRDYDDNNNIHNQNPLYVDDVKLFTNNKKWAENTNRIVSWEIRVELVMNKGELSNQNTRRLELSTRLELED